MPMRWTELREELEHSTGATTSRLNRMMARLTARSQLTEKKAPGSNARLFEDADVALLRAEAAKLKDQPQQIPANLAPYVKGKPKSEPKSEPSQTVDEALSVERLAESEGPKNTRKSLTDKEKRDDDTADEKKGDRKSLVKWLVIGAGVVTLGVLALGYIKRRRAMATAYVPPAAEPPQQEDEFAGGGGDFGGDMQSYVDEIRRRAVGR